MYKVILMNLPEIVYEYEDIFEAVARMEELLRDGVEARIEYGGILWKL